MYIAKALLLVVVMVMSHAVLVAQSGVTRVWAVDEGEKVKQDELNHWARTDARNPVWDGSTIRVFGGRNEVVGFQVILEAAGTGATGVDVRLDGLQGPGYVITNSGGIGDPMDFVGKRIEVFVESYINVTKRSDFSGTWGWVRPMPDAEHLGLIPDGLVPVEAPNKSPAHGAGGAPFPIGAGRTQGVWIDVYIPPEAPAGLYAGTVRVLQNGTETHQIPIALQVYGFTLSDSTHFHTMFAYGGLIAQRHGYPEGSAEFWRLMHNYMNVFHRHRMDLNPGNQTVASFASNLGGYYTGEYYSSTFKYDGPGVSVGNQTYGIGLYDQPENGWASGFWPNTAASWQSAADAWETWFRTNAPSVDRFKYLTDEPIPANYGIDIERATWIRNSPGVGKNLKTYCTVKMDPRLYGTVNFWALTGQSGYDPGDGVSLGYISNLVKQRKALGEKVAIYNGTRPGYGVTEPLDNVLADNRVNPWIAFKHDVDQYFLWIVGFISGLSINRDVWVDNYYGDATTVAWGSGQYVYPGEDTKIPSQSRGVEGPIVSMRMKNFRRGMQDYEYLWLARQAGISEDTLQAIMNSVVPAVLDEIPQGNQPMYAERGYPYESARRRLAELLAQTVGGVVMPTGSLRVTPSILPVGGGTVTLQWNATNAATAVLDNGVGTLPLSGSLEVPVTKTTVFRLLLRNEQSQRTISASVVVSTSPAEVGPNLTRNSGFESGADSWFFYTDGSGSFTSTSPGYFSTKAGRVEISSGGSNIQLFQTDTPLKPGVVYRLSFYAMASSGKDIDVSVFQHPAPNTDYGLMRQRCDLGTTWRKFSFEFLPQNISAPVSDGRLQFWLASNAQAGDVYQFDEVTLREIGPAFSMPLASPTFVAPVRGSFESPSYVRLTWRMIEGAESYHVQVSTREDFSSLLVDEVVADTALDIGPLESSTKYYRRVLSRGPRGETAFCPVCNFGTTSFKTSVDGESLNATGFVLHQNYPNPFNPTTVIRYSLPARSDVNLRVYNTLGEEVLTLVQGEQSAGAHQVAVNAEGLPSGMYLYRLQTPGSSETRRMALVR